MRGLQERRLPVTIVAHIYLRHGLQSFQPNEPRLSPVMAVRWLFYYAPTAPLHDDTVPLCFSAPVDARHWVSGYVPVYTVAAVLGFSSWVEWREGLRSTVRKWTPDLLAAVLAWQSGG
jgi:hypothetical protein